MLKKLKLLEQINLKIPRQDGTTIEINGLQKIKLSVFKALDDDKFLELRKTSALDFIYAHFYSLSGIQALIMLRNKNLSTEQGLKEIGSQIFDPTEDELDFNL